MFCLHRLLEVVRSMTQDRRHSERIATRMKVMFGRSGPNFHGYTLNISERGFAIEAYFVFPPDSEICIDLYVGHEIVRLSGNVVWDVSYPNVFNSKMGIMLSQSIHELIKARFSLVPVEGDIITP